MGNWNEATRALGGYLRIPEPMVTELMCPKCGAINVDDRQHYIWRVADERGLHAECDACATFWVPESWKTNPA